jgi:hypothetical protein
MVFDIELKFHWFKIHSWLLPNYKDVLEKLDDITININEWVKHMLSRK